MTLRVKVSARAASQIDKAAEWWAENRPAAPGAIRTDIGEALVLLAQQPGIGAKYEGARTAGVRRLLVGRVRYFSNSHRLAVSTFHSSSGVANPIFAVRRAFPLFQACTNSDMASSGERTSSVTVFIPEF